MISVCLASYNGEKYIKEQVDSILAQLSGDDELIVSDDGSNDQTLKILHDYNDNRIKIYHHSYTGKSKRIGDIVSCNFENALKYAKGDYIFLSDQDDIWLPNKVTTMVKALEKVCVACSNAWLLTSGNICVCTELLYDGRNPLNNYILKSGKYYGCCMAFRKECLDYLLPFPNPMPLHDAWIGLLPEIVGGAIFIDEPLIYYRRHGENLSGGMSPNSLFYKIWYRLYFLSHVFYRAARCKIRFVVK